jgi:hypothetical protein
MIFLLRRFFFVTTSFDPKRRWKKKFIDDTAAAFSYIFFFFFFFFYNNMPEINTYPGVTKPLSLVQPTEQDLLLTKKLEATLQENGCYESPEKTERRYICIQLN